jgi:hypothetical protein
MSTRAFDTSKESNARILGIFSVIFSIVPIVGLILGIIATQKGRRGVSSFAIKAGWIGIGLSVIFAISFGLYKYNTQQKAERTRVYAKCLEDASFEAQQNIDRGFPYTAAMQACIHLEP